MSFRQPSPGPSSSCADAAADSAVRVGPLYLFIVIPRVRDYRTSRTVLLIEILETKAGPFTGCSPIQGSLHPGRTGESGVSEFPSGRAALLSSPRAGLSRPQPAAAVAGNTNERGKKRWKE